MLLGLWSRRSSALQMWKEGVRCGIQGNLAAKGIKPPRAKANHLGGIGLLPYQNVLRTTSRRGSPTRTMTNRVATLFISAWTLANSISRSLANKKRKKKENHISGIIWANQIRINSNALTWESFELYKILHTMTHHAQVTLGFHCSNIQPTNNA